MKKFGFGKKEDGGEDSNRMALFGSKSKSKSPAPSANPYAQPSAPLDPYSQAKAHAYGRTPSPQSAAGGYSAPLPPAQGGYAGPPPNNKGYGGIPGDNKVQSDNGYGSNSSGYNGGRYGAEKYGTQNGYGADRYGTTASSSQNTASRYGAGGYGGLGGVSAYDNTGDDDRDVLFGGAKDRLKQKPQTPSVYGQPPPYDEDNQEQGYGSSFQPGPVYEDRQLTAEEEEDEDVKATKQNIRFMKQEDVASTRNALRIAQQAEETGRDTLARLGTQGENLHNTEKNLDLAHNQNKMAEDKARELKTLNKSMFAVHVSNPFTASSRREARDQAVIDRHLDERDARESTRRAAVDTNKRMQKNFKELQPGDQGYGKPRGKNLADRAKYQFEADSEDEEMENEIDGNLDQLTGVTSRLNMLARATGEEVDRQNTLIDGISNKTDRVDIGIASNHAKINRIR